MAIALSGSLVITGSIFATQGITGSFSGSATSASYADTLQGLGSASFAPAATFNTVSQSFATTSGSLSTRVTNLESTSSIVSSSFAITSGSLSTRVTNLESTSSTVSSSFATTSGSIAGRVTLIEGQYATTGSNNFTGPQYVNQASNAISFTSTASLYTNGGLRVSKDSFVSGTAYFNNVVVYGTSSIQYITSSQVNFGTNIITVNTDTPAVRFGGLAVFDSGSTQLTGSILWDSEKNNWIYSNPSGSTYDGGMIISGPRNTSGLGNEVGTTSCALMMGQGGDHITSSMIYSYGNATCFYGQSFISSSGAACFNSTVCAPAGLIAGCGDLTIDPVGKCVTVGRISAVSGDNSTFVVRDRTDALRAVIPGGGSINTIFRTNASCVIVQNYSGTDMFRIANDGTAYFSGNVGIGTASPFAIADVNLTANGPGSSAIQLGVADVRNAQFYANGAEVRVYAVTNVPLRFGTNDTERMRISECGYVAVTGNQALSCVPYLQGMSFGWNRTNGQGESMINWTNAGGGNACDLVFNFKDSTTLYERLRITSTGISCFACQVCSPSLRVQSAFADLTLCGSNTTSPHIGGTFTITTNQDGNGRTIIGNAAVGRAMYLEANGNVTFNCVVSAPAANISTSTICTIASTTLGSSRGIVIDANTTTNNSFVPIGFSWASSVSSYNPTWGMALKTISYNAGTADLVFYTGNNVRLTIGNGGGATFSGGVTAGSFSTTTCTFAATSPGTNYDVTIPGYSKWLVSVYSGAVYHWNGILALTTFDSADFDVKILTCGAYQTAAQVGVVGGGTQLRFCFSQNVGNVTLNYTNIG